MYSIGLVTPTRRAIEAIDAEACPCRPNSSMAAARICASRRARGTPFVPAPGTEPGAPPERAGPDSGAGGGAGD
ncbi:hypothetical protein GCM10010504_49480 [Streptomyces griseus]|nr:hypothetical protein GCM10010504_49480 [Streptomyces griseus]